MSRLVRDGHDVAGDRPGARSPDQQQSKECGQQDEPTRWSRLSRQGAMPYLTNNVHDEGAQTCRRLSTAFVISVIASAIGTPFFCCLLYTSPSPRDRTRSRMPSSA